MAIELPDLTGGEKAGSGVFDELMRTVKAHLEGEFNSGRINQDEYANIYLGAMQSTMQTALQFTLQYQVTNQQILLMQEQTRQISKQIELTDEQIAQIKVQTASAQYTLDEIMPLQKAQLTVQNQLISEQVTTEINKAALTASQKLQVDAQTLLTGKQEDLVDEQIKTEAANTVDPTGGLAKATFDKSVAEAALLAQRNETEKAQTTGRTPAETPAGTLEGILGAQRHLIMTQRDGFERDSEQKAAKIFMDAFSVAHSITPTTYTPDIYGLDGANATKAVNKLLTGLGA